MQIVMDGDCSNQELQARAGRTRQGFIHFAALISLATLVLGLSSCSGSANRRVEAAAERLPTVGVVKAEPKSLSRSITLSSELVPFQEIDVYAKEAGYVQNLYVDYGSHVKKGQVMATLDIPELVAQLDVDQAEIKRASDEVILAQHQLNRYEAQYKVLHLEYTRLNGVFQTQPGIVAQQEVDDAQGKDIAAAAQVDAGKAAFSAAQSRLMSDKAKLIHDQALFDYSKITAPFTGVVTDRYANLGTLMQAGTGSSTQALPLVRLSEDDLFRLVIPVPESYVRFIRLGDTAEVTVPSLNRKLPGTVARFSVDVKQSTRTMHTEVDVPNPDRVLMPGMYADADLTLEHKEHVLAVPLQAVNHEAGKATVYFVNSSGVIEDRPIMLGLQTADDAEILSGLKPGDQVVVSDRSGLKPGEKVQPKLVELLRYKEGNEQ
jgi:RND family efflux transporter MFP subunit